MGDTAEPDSTGGAAAASNGGALTGVQGLVQALHGLIDVQRSSGFTKHLKPPSMFAPENRGDELNKWMDWRFQFETFVGAVDPSMLSHMKNAEKEENPINDGLPSVRSQSERLYSLLTGLMKQRPLRLVRGVTNQNGLEAWRVITKDLQPKTRQRSLALIQLHIQMTLQDDTTFEDLRQRIEMYEQVSQRWTSEGGLQMGVKPLMDQGDQGEPMEIDAIWSKGGKKGGKKGKKGKDKGKSSKGKTSWSKDGGKKGGKSSKGSGKQDGKKGKGGNGVCPIVEGLGILLGSAGAKIKILEDAALIDPDELRIQIDEAWFDKETKLKDLQEACKQLGLATSGSKIKVLRRLQSYKHHQEEKMAYEIAQRLFSESRREAIPLKTPKLPSRHEQELHQLTHLPFQSWCQQCVATRSKEDPRTKEDQADRKDRGRPVISFDYGFTYTTGVPEDRQWGTALY
ncbi:unnamed protein product, partial [Durusdinium trenchii]